MNPKSQHLPWGALVAACMLGVATPGHTQTQPAPPTATAPTASAPIAEATPETTVLTLDQVIRTVLAHNPDLLAAQQTRAIATAAITSASALANPRLEWSSGRNSARLPSVTPGTVQSVGVSQFIDNPWARSARIDAARAHQAGSTQLIAQTRNALVAQVRLRAFEYQLRRAEAAAASDAVALLEQVRERVRLRVESGEAPRYETIKAEAEIINARQRQQTAQLQAEQTLVGLNRLAAGRLPARWTLEGTLDDAFQLPSLDEIQAQAQAENPDLRALQAEIDRAQAQLQAARASRVPGVELRYGRTQEPEVRQNMLGISVQIPLLDQRDGPIAEAAIELERARDRLAGRKAELGQQVLQAWQALDMARLRAQALSQGAVREAEAALRVAQAAYRFGERGILDVLDAQRILRSVRGDLIEARFQVQAARIELEALTGRYAEEASAPTQPRS